jgi:surface antigen
VAAAAAGLALSACGAAEFVETRLAQVKAELAADDAAREPLYVRLTDGDIELADHTLQRALETATRKKTLSWRNTASGNAGTITPTRTYKTKGGHFCRVYREVVVVGSESELYVDTACRDRASLWIPIE